MSSYSWNTKVGEINIGQRRVEGSLILAGEAPGADDVSGSITVPEVAHDTEESEYVVCSLTRLPYLVEGPLT